MAFGGTPLQTIADCVSLFVAIEHFLFFLLETNAHSHQTKKAFGYPSKEANTLSGIFAQIGCYNTFLTFLITYGLTSSRTSSDPKLLGTMFASWAGVYGWASLGKPTILYSQALPALTANFLTVWGLVLARGGGERVVDVL